MGYISPVTGVEFVLWGLFGGFSVEGLDLYTAIRGHRRWPWQRDPAKKEGGTGSAADDPEVNEPGAAAYLVAGLIRLVIGAGLALAAGASNQIDSPVAAIAVGVAAPLIFERLAKTVPIDIQPKVAEPPLNPQLDQGQTSTSQAGT